MKIIVTGSNGQLGQCIQKIAPKYTTIKFYFFTSSELDITQEDELENVFSEIKPDFCINAAAYTQVDLAEENTEKAFQVNAMGAKYLGQVCHQFNTTLIHVSTDYVFDGDTQISYSEDNFTNPIGVYGQSKLQGEQYILDEAPNSIIIRTSWLYSEFNKNFVKTMLTLFQQKTELSVINDQFGQPTYAIDLAKAILQIILQNQNKYGVFHFSNYPETSWFNFATKIAQLSHSKIQLKPITTSEYPTKAKRPMRSTFCLDKIEDAFSIDIKHWENSLAQCLQNIEQLQEKQP
jgi:dTDP-4-dehydrorhamnose reductase